jgi:hypothetical protein
MSITNKTKLLIAVRKYKVIKSERKTNYTDISVVDPLNKKVLLRTIDPLSTRYVDLNDVNSLTNQVKFDAYDSAILISNNFTQSATSEMARQNIQCISETYMPPYTIEDLYGAVMNLAGPQCGKKCGKTPERIPDCEIKDADMCSIWSLACSAKNHFETGSIGLLKNDLKMALALGPVNINLVEKNVEN